MGQAVTKVGRRSAGSTASMRSSRRAMGLLLAVPVPAGMKIIFDHVESLKPIGSWLGESVQNGNGKR